MRDDEEELAVNGAVSSSLSDMRAAAEGVPLADFECPHGRLLAAGESCERCEEGRTMQDMIEDLKPEPQADSLRCVVEGCPNTRGSKGGPFQGRCDIHAEELRQQIAAKRRANKPPKQAKPELTVSEEELAEKIGRLVGKVVDAKIRRDAAEDRLSELRRQLNELLS